MRKVRLLYVFKNQKKKLFVNSLACLGFLWLVIESTSFFIKPANEYISNNIWLLILILILSFCYGVFKSLPKTKISKQFRNLNTAVKIEIGELLEKEGNLIIASSDYFDTTNSNTKSLKTQLINKYFNSAVKNLDSQIEDSLKEQNLIGKENKDKTYGKAKQFNIGTTAIVNIPSNSNIQIFITVICKVVYEGSSKKKKSDLNMLKLALENIWATIKNRNNNGDIYTPILGAGVTGLSYSKLTLSQLIIISFLLNSKNNKIGKSLNIVVPLRNYSPELFERLDYFINSFEI